MLTCLCLFAGTPLTASETSWEVTTAHPPQPEELLVTEQFLNETKERIERAMKVYSSIPAVAGIAQTFDKGVRPTLFVIRAGQAMSVFVSSESVPPDPAMWGQEVVIYGQQAYSHPMIRQRLLFYHAPWNAVISAGIKWAHDAWFEAVVLHELYHAQQHKIGAEGSKGGYTEAWFREEVDAHILERRVLDTATSGVYAERLATVVSELAAPDIQTLTQAIQPSHVDYLNELFGPASENEMVLRRGQYYIDLLMTWVEHTHSVVRWDKKRIEAYRFLTQR